MRSKKLKIVSRSEAGRFHVTGSDPDAEETQQARLRAEKMCTSEKRNTCKKMDPDSRSDPVLVFHMAVTAITAGTKPLPTRLHHVH